MIGVYGVVKEVGKEMKQVTYWNEEMETLSREKLEELQLQRFRERMQYVYERSPMYKRKYDEAGIKPVDIRTLDDIQNVPFTIKEELQGKPKEPSSLGRFYVCSSRGRCAGFSDDWDHRYPCKGHSEQKRLGPALL